MIFGDGLKRILFIATALVTVKKGILLLDELEGGIHAFLLPAVMKWLLKAAVTMNVQIFATTHSLDAVDALLKAAEDSQEEFTTYRLTKEDHVAKRMNYNLLTDLRVKGGLEIR
jgi:AAA15 family ATPase/GTPase